MADDETFSGSADTEHYAAHASESGRIGPYLLLRKIGEGGMGEVWLAEQQEPIRRQVALKVIKQGMDTRQVVARFEAERQALAMMDHPAIAKIHDAGSTPEGRPFFAMEYVKGIPITEYCDKHRLPMRERLGLFIRACDGVQHAHQKAVIHRDLKPGNILVADSTGTPQPKIIDFGVAKATAARLTERTMHTEFGQLIGTPEYMSPEQADLTAEDVDTRSDVYAMGVILYQLLVGALPFDARELRASGFDGIRRVIREVDPPTPSSRFTSLGDAGADVASNRRERPDQLQRALKGDLDWIVMKALEKDRNRRYETANGLAADIRRHLADEPVVARPPDRVYRMQKLVRRNKAAFSALAAILVVLVVAVAATSWGMVRAVRAERRAEEETSIARAVNDFLNDDLLAAVAPSGQKGRGRDVPMREVLDVAAERIEEDADTRARFAGVPPVEAAIRTTLGRTYRRLGEYPAAEPHLKRALEIRTEHPGPERLDLADALMEMAELADDQGRYDQAEDYAKQAIAIQVAARGEHDETAIAARTRLARIYSAQGRSVEAEQMLLRVLDSQRRLSGGGDQATVKTMGTLASLYQELGRNDEAEALQVEALEIRKRSMGEEDPGTMSAMNNLANVYASQGRLDEAIPLYTRSLELKRRVLGDDHPSTLNTWNNLAEVEEVRGNYAHAEELHLEVLERRTRALGVDHPQSLRSRTRIAYVQMKLGRPDEAERGATTVIAATSRTLGPEHPQTIETEDVLGMILLAQGRAVESERLLRRVRQTVIEEQPDDLYTRTLVTAHLGLALATLDRIEEAEEMWSESAGDLPTGDAETSSILEAVVAHFDRWNTAEPGKGYAQKAEQWRQRLALAQAG